MLDRALDKTGLQRANRLLQSRFVELLQQKFVMTLEPHPSM
jgi:hypothetical protein